jgi:hypothetical protein
MYALNGGFASMGWRLYGVQFNFRRGWRSQNTIAKGVKAVSRSQPQHWTPAVDEQQQKHCWVMTSFWRLDQF